MACIYNAYEYGCLDISPQSVFTYDGVQWEFRSGVIEAAYRYISADQFQDLSLGATRRDRVAREAGRVRIRAYRFGKSPRLVFWHLTAWQERYLRLLITWRIIEEGFSLTEWVERAPQRRAAGVNAARLHLTRLFG